MEIIRIVTFSLLWTNKSSDHNKVSVLEEVLRMLSNLNVEQRKGRGVGYKLRTLLMLYYPNLIWQGGHSGIIREISSARKGEVSLVES